MVEDGKIRHIDNFDVIMNHSDEKINLKGYTVLPGFIDSHTHMIKMGLNMERVDLSDTDSMEEAKYYLSKEAEKKEEGEWVVGIDFDETDWKKGDFLKKNDLDEVSTEHPIMIKRVCGHIAIVNSEGLSLVEEEEHEDKIDEEKGMLLEEAVWDLEDKIGVDKEDKIDAIKRAIERAHELGVTGVHDIVDKEGWEAYVELDEEDSLDLRVRCYIVQEDIDELEPTEKSQFLSLRGIKIFVDGSLGGHTAALFDEYSDDPGNKGMLLHSQEELEDIIREAEGRGFQVMAHAIGDRAIDVLLNSYEKASSRTDHLRHRIEHAEVLSPEEIRRIRELNLILSAQPNFAYKWSKPGGMNEKRLGEKRLQKCNPYWDIQRALVKMAFGSDTMPMSPLFGVFSATNHPILEQRISAYNALQSYITNSAYAGKDEERIGELSSGMDADFIVLSENPLDSDNIDEIDVIMTVVDGKIVYDDRGSD